MRLYKPTISEKKKFEKIVKSLAPTEASYRKYKVQVDHFLENHSVLPFRKSLSVKKFSKIQSRLFNREFLVGYASKSWLNEMAPGCNAIASTSLEVGLLKSPPIVLMPAQQKNVLTDENLSILEHEFVHVCQAINGTFPGEYNKNSKDLIGQFLTKSHAEYHANYLQLSKWPHLYPMDIGLSLNEWCVLRGITQSLETLLQTGINGNLSERKLLASLRALSKISISDLKKFELYEPRISSLLKDPESLVAKALGILLTQSPSLIEQKVFLKLVTWAQSS